MANLSTAGDLRHSAARKGSVTTTSCAQIVHCSARLNEAVSSCFEAAAGRAHIHMAIR